MSLDAFIALELGSSSFRAMPVRRDGTGDLVSGEFREVAPVGLQKGLIADQEAVSLAVRDLMSLMPGDISDVLLAVPTTNWTLCAGKSSLAIPRETRKVDLELMAHAVDLARQSIVTDQHEPLVAMPTSFEVDGYDQPEPVGLTGNWLSVTCNILAAPKDQVALTRAITGKTPKQITQIIPSILAKALVTLTQTELNSEVVLVDLGGSRTQAARFSEGSLRSTWDFGVAGNSVTNDLRHVLNVDSNEAERIKREFGKALVDLADPDQIIAIHLSDGHIDSLEAAYLCQIIESRMAEIARLVKSKVGHTRRIVLCGGGSLLPGTTDLFEATWDVPVRHVEHRPDAALKGLVQWISQMTEWQEPA